MRGSDNILMCFAAVAVAVAVAVLQSAVYHIQNSGVDRSVLISHASSKSPSLRQVDDIVKSQGKHAEEAAILIQSAVRGKLARNQVEHIKVRFVNP